MVANVDSTGAVWMPEMRIQKKNREHIVYMMDAVSECIMRYMTRTGGSFVFHFIG